MNTQSNAAPGPLAEAGGFSTTAASVLQPFYWSIRRELWETRTIYVAPLAAAALFLFGLDRKSVV